MFKKLFNKEAKKVVKYMVLDYGCLCYEFDTEEEAREVALKIHGREEEFVVVEY